MPAFVTPRICIVGGGPAGLAAAIALSQKGFAVTVSDCAIPPIDKACGEGLLPDTLSALDQLGVKIPSSAGRAFSGVRFLDERSNVTARFRQGSGLGVRRTVLHSLLVMRATEAGADLRWGVKHESSRSWDLVIGADGQNSRVRGETGLNQGSKVHHRYAFRQHFQVAPWSDFVDVHWSHRSQLYVTPIGAEEVGIAVISRDRRLRLREALVDFPSVAERLRSALQLSTERGSLSSMRILPSVLTRDAVLVGDASGSVDAITGEGLGLAFRQALALAQALASGNLNGYAKAHADISHKARQMANVLLTLDAHPGVRRLALAGLAVRPQVFESLLAFHTGKICLPRLKLIKELNADVPVIIP